MRSDRPIDRLAAAAALHLERSRDDLRRIEADLAALRRAADALRAQTAGPATLLDQRGEAATLAARWDALRQTRLIELGRQMAELAARRETARRAVARSFGRTVAIDRLREPRS